MLKYLALLPIAALVCGSAFGQDAPPIAETPADNGNIPATLIQPIEHAADYLNFYAFYNGIYDSPSQTGGTALGSGYGQQFGGGISANHDFAKGIFSFGYRGDYRTATDPQFVGGTEQTLSFFVRRLLTRRWTVSLQEEAGTFPEGTVTQQPTSTVDQQYIQTSPFSTDYRFSGTTLTVAYRETARLSYAFTGTFILSRYTTPYGLGNDDLIGTASVIYRYTPATTFSGTYQNTYYHFQRNAGTAQTSSEYLTVSHLFPNHWTVGASGGITHVTSQGSYPVALYVKEGDNLIPFVFVGHYQTSANLPYLSASASRSWHHFLASFTGGETVTPGNGVFLTSKTFGVSGVISYSTRRSNISGLGSWSRLTSASNTVSVAYHSTDFGAGYSYNLIRHLGATARVDYVSNVFNQTNVGATDRRFSVGLYFTSKDIPVAIF